MFLEGRFCCPSWSFGDSVGVYRGVFKHLVGAYRKTYCKNKIPEVEVDVETTVFAVDRLVLLLAVGMQQIHVMIG